MKVRTQALTVLVVGAGGREHALAWACSRSPLVDRVLCAPGNGGTAGLGTNVAVSATDPAAVARVAAAERADLVVVGPDAAIAAGVTDAVARVGIPCFAPTQAAGELESSKVFAKRLMARLGIHTAPFRVFQDPQLARAHLLSRSGPVVVKADGLALGKGAFVCSDPGEAILAVDRLMVRQELGEAGRVVVVEDVLAGREVSFFAICDGTRAVMLPPVCDYKRALEKDLGANTGGMGGYSPPRDLDARLLNRRALEEIVLPVLAEMGRIGRPFRGCLYVGAMLSGSEIQVLEFNARFGDPEAEIMLPGLPDVVPYLLGAARGALDLPPLAMPAGASVGIVAVRTPYPDRVEPGGRIEGLDGAIAEGCLVFQMGTRVGEGGTAEVSGGRVLVCVAHGASLGEARSRAYRGIARIDFAGMRYRSDIAA